MVFNVSGGKVVPRNIAAVSFDMTQTASLLRRIPDSEREFSISAAEALAKYKLDADLLDCLRTAGLPHVLHDGKEMFDATDLLNIALRVDYGSTQRKHLAWWIRELDWQSNDYAVSYLMDYISTCPDPSHDAPCRYELLGLSGRRPVDVAPSRRPQVLAREKVTLPRSWPEFPRALKDIIDDVSDIEFLKLPESLRWDVEYLMQMRVGDCSGMAMLLSRIGAECGLRSRVSFGRALTPPLSSPHYWTEFFIDGIWTPVDPLMVSALQGVGLPRERWTPYSSIGGILCRFADEWQAIGVHNGIPIPVRVAARRQEKLSRADLEHLSDGEPHAR